MPPPDDFLQSAEYIALLDKLVEGGWITQVIRHQRGHFLFTWTPRGLQGASLMKAVARDLSLGPKGLHALLVFCELHGKDLPGQPEN
jgi:hypothetical protein